MLLLHYRCCLQCCLSHGALCMPQGHLCTGVWERLWTCFPLYSSASVTAVTSPLAPLRRDGPFPKQNIEACVLGGMWKSRLQLLRAENPRLGFDTRVSLTYRAVGTVSTAALPPRRSRTWWDCIGSSGCLNVCPVSARCVFCRNLTGPQCFVKTCCSVLLCWVLRAFWVVRHLFLESNWAQLLGWTVFWGLWGPQNSVEDVVGLKITSKSFASAFVVEYKWEAMEKNVFGESRGCLYRYH